MGLPLLMQGGREVLEAGEAWGSRGRGALNGVTYSSMLTVSGLAVWKTVLATIFPVSASFITLKTGYLPFLVSVPLSR